MARRQRGTRGRRTIRRNNPTQKQWLLGGALVGGAAAIAAYAIHESGKPDRVRPIGPIPTPDPRPLPGKDGVVGTGDPCTLGDQYPGFQWDGVECVPGPETPAGIYITDECSDFIFVPGDEGAQPEDLDARIQSAALAADSDPPTIAADFLSSFWPQCAWPPEAGASDRIVQLYMALSTMISRMVISIGGSVLGSNDPEAADEALGERFVELGYDMFHPELVPEIEIPEVDPETQEPSEGTGGVGGGGYEPPPPGPGLIDDGGPTGPQGQPQGQDDDDDPPYCSTQATTREEDAILTQVAWNQTRAAQIRLFTPVALAECTKYEITFGLCITPLSYDDTIGAILQTYPGAGFAIRDEQGEPANIALFRKPLLWKKQYKCTITVAPNGNVTPNSVVPTPISDPNVDPCKTKNDHWPHGKFQLQNTEKQDNAYQWQNWNGDPLVLLKAEDNKLFVRILYQGLPWFVAMDGSGGLATKIGRVRIDKSNRYAASVKVRAIGKI